MKRFYATSFFLFTLLFSLTLVAQEQIPLEYPKIKRRDFKQQETGFNEAWDAIREGNKFFNAGGKDYKKALEKYWIGYDYNKANAALNYRIGVCYLMIGGNRMETVEYLETAYKIDPYVTNNINLLLGRAYHLNLEFDKAIKEYQSFLDQFEEKDREIRVYGYDAIVQKLIEECKAGNELIQQPRRVIIQNIESLNTPADEYNPIFNDDQTSMHYTARRSDTRKEAIYKPDNKYKEDIYIAHKNKENEWEDHGPLSYKRINTKFNDAIVAVSNNGRRLYLYRGDYRGRFMDGMIFVVDNKKGKWKKPKKIDKNLRSKGKETSIFLADDEKTMYLVSDREDNSLGGRDIFIARKDKKGNWEKPQNLGAKINTPYDEESPYLSQGGDTLFFASRGHNSMGGFDLFYSTKDIEGNWKTPVNMGYPVNTPDHELFYKVGKDPRHGYFTSVRDQGKGGKDMYEITFLGTEKEPRMSYDRDLIVWDMHPKPDLFYRAPKALIIDTSLFLIGTVTDNSTAEGIVSRLQLIDMETSQATGVTLSEEPDGNYRIKLPDDAKRKFGIEITAKGYMYFIDQIDLSGENFSNDMATRNFTLEKLAVGAKMILKNIYFETAKATLRSDSYEELNRVVDFLEENPSVRIEISGHTDNIGSHSYNKKLSRDRAKSVVDYIAGQGIDKGRLQSEGYAFEQPVAPNTTEEGRAQNRRVEFRILSVE